MRSNNTKQIALSGMLAAVAVVIMALGGFIPVATYVCPMLCCMTQFIVFRFCGRRLAWTWFIVVSILALLMSPDKEAAMVFAAIGYYPLIKQSLDQHRFGIILKLLYFNASVLIAYGIMIYLLGMQEIAAENTEFGAIGLLVILLLGNAAFFLLDKLLAIMAGKCR